MSIKDSMPEFLQVLREHKYNVGRLDSKNIAEFELYKINLSDWRLRLELTPVIWVKARMVQVLSASELAGTLNDIAREREWLNSECIVLFEGNGRAIKQQTSGRDYPLFVILDRLDQENILAARSVPIALQEKIIERVPISELAPYQVGGPVEGSRFFGRTALIRRILRQTDNSFAIVGVRRIGKTSLLMEIHRRLLLQGESPERLCYLDCSNLKSIEEFVTEIVSWFYVRDIAHIQAQTPRQYLIQFTDFLRRMLRRYGGRLTMFLDEFDKLLDSSINSRELLETLKASAHAGYCRYILAGFQSLMKEHIRHESPLYHAFNTQHLGPFEKDETINEVVLRPMRLLRVRIESEVEFASRIFADTRGYPLLVQFYCQELIETMENEGRRTLYMNDLKQIYESNGFKDIVFSSFRESVNTRDKLLVYALLSYFPESKEAYTQEDIHEALTSKGIPTTFDEIESACDRLELTGFFIREALAYQFAIPVFPRHLRANYDFDYRLRKMKEE